MNAKKLDIFMRLRALFEGLTIRETANGLITVSVGRLQSEPLTLRQCEYILFNNEPLTIAELHKRYKEYDYSECYLYNQPIMAIKPAEQNYYQVQIGKGQYQFTLGNTPIVYTF